MSGRRATNRGRPALEGGRVGADPDPRRNPPASRTRLAWLAVALVAITVVVYAPVRHHAFVSIDDSIYVADNPHVTGGLGPQAVLWAFTTGYANFWHPLTWLSLMLDVQMFGVDPGRLHVTSALLHLTAALLLLVVLYQATGAPGRSALVAALFAVHPLHVESVAWIAERKDTLSTLFAMLTILAWFAYLRRPNPWRYLATASVFAMGLMAKPMLVTLPFVLLLLDVWPLGRIRFAGDGAIGRLRADLGRRVWEKIPLFALAAAAAVVAFLAQQQGGAVADTASFPVTGRVANALVAYLAYIGRTVWPARLVPFYPYPQSVAVAPAIGSLLVLGGISVVAVRFISSRPYLAVGWFWYVGTLLPVSGLVQVGSHAMADRYTYVPLVGLFIVLAWGVPELVARWPTGRRALPFLAVGLVLAHAAVARAQVMTWRDSVVLWQHALEVMPDNYFAHNAIGLEMKKQGRLADAMAHFVEASRLAPGFPNAHENAGSLLAAQGRIDQAVSEFRQAVALAPGRAAAHLLLGGALLKAGRAEEGLSECREALGLSPSAETHTAVGNALLQAGRVAEAIGEFREAIATDGRFADARYNLANAYRRAGRLDEAASEYREALQIQPERVEAHNNLGATLASLGRPEQAAAEYEESLRIDPNSAPAHGNLATLLLAAGRPQDAVPHYLAALQANPDDAQARTNLGTAFQELGRFDEAIAEHAKAVRLNPAFADAHFNLANALARVGRFAEAAAEYEETLRLEGESQEVRAQLAAARAAMRRRPLGPATVPSARKRVTGGTR